MSFIDIGSTTLFRSAFITSVSREAIVGSRESDFADIDLPLKKKGLKMKLGPDRQKRSLETDLIIVGKQNFSIQIGFWFNHYLLLDSRREDAAEMEAPVF
jgi:hypothetical protein